MKIKHALAHYSDNGRLAVWLVLFSLMLSSCATQVGVMQKVTWHCDPEADAAFEHGDWEIALAAHENLLSSDPTNGLALYHLGYIYGKLGDREKEVQTYQQAIDNGYNQDDQIYFNLGMSLGDLGRMQEAEAALRKAVAIKPQSPDNHFGLGIILQTRGKSDEAQKVFIEAVRIDPHLWEARLALARLYLDQSRWELAKQQLEAVQKGDPENEEAQELRQTLKSRQNTQYEQP
jgi:tetratricopeptide (TPR) repeat protein